MNRPVSKNAGDSNDNVNAFFVLLVFYRSHTFLVRSLLSLQTLARNERKYAVVVSALFTHRSF